MTKHPGIILLGSPRSGTTLMRRILNEHPDIACPPETHVLNACARFIQSDAMGAGLNVGVLAGLGFAGFDDSDVLGRLRKLAFGFFEDHAKQQGKSRWAEKTAFDSFYITEIDRLFGDHAYFICIVRHGVDVALSMKDLCDRSGGYLRELHDYIKLYPKPLEAFARAWADVTTDILEFHSRHPDNSLLVRYEDLVADPDAAMSRIMNFVDAEWEPQTLRQALESTGNVGFADWKTYGKASIDAESIGRWRNLSAAELSELAEIVNATLARCGYSQLAITNAKDDEDARRRYELGLLLQAAKKEGNSSTDN